MKMEIDIVGHTVLELLKELIYSFIIQNIFDSSKNTAYVRLIYLFFFIFLFIVCKLFIF